MPIVIKDIVWRQSDTTIHIQVPIPGTHAKVDLFTTDSFIKAHFHPFIAEIYLLHDVNISKSTCVVKEDMILLDLAKREEIEWETLEKDLTKAEKLNAKQEILKKCQEDAAKASEDKRIRKTELDRFTVQKAMEIDTYQLELMESRKNEQTKKAMDELETWRLNSMNISRENYSHKAHKAKITELPPEISRENYSSKVKITELPPETANVKDITDKKNDKTNNEDKTVKTAENKSIAKPKKAPKKERKTPVKSQYVDKKKEELAKRTLPKLRETGDIEIKHTRRTFPTPSRESAQQEEEAWLKNVTMARRATGFVSEDLRPEEQDPQWCKEKGDEFFRNGNFLGAISAYTHGILLSDKLPSLFANRAATHFALGNFNKCANDCSTALELLVPPCEGNRESRAKCIARRAAALARLGYLNKAIDEMKAASKLLPDDESIKKDIYDMERAWEQNPDSE